MQLSLRSFHIIEKFNNIKFITWTYPNITETIRDCLMGNIFERIELTTYSYYRSVSNEWIYIWERRNETKTYALALVTKSYDPKKYKKLGETMCNNYEKSYNSVLLVKIFLGALTTGLINEDGVNVKMDSIETKSNHVIKDLVRLFGIEIILIYNALLIKKRVLVYHSSFVLLQKSLSAITHLIDQECRDPNEYLFPFIKNINQDLKGKNFFVAGTNDKNSVKYDNYDIFVNLEKESINIAPNSKETFVLTKIHKEVAKMMVQYTEDDVEELKLAEELHNRTNDILINLKSLAATHTAENKSMITLEELRSRKLTSAMENFLFNLAVAENIMML